MSAQRKDFDFAASETASLRSIAQVRQALRTAAFGPGSWALVALVLVALTSLFVSSFLVDGRRDLLGLTILLGLLALLGFGLAIATSHCVCAPRWADLVVALVGVSLALFMTRGMGMHLLVAAGATGTLLGCAALPGMPLDVMGAGSGYAAMFAGLVSPVVTLPYWTIILAGLLAGLLFSAIGPSLMPGVGARMGTAAFIGGSLVYFAANLAGAEQPAILPPPAAGTPHWALVPVALGGAWVTWALVVRLGMPFVLASASTTLLVCAGTTHFLPSMASVLGTAWLGATLVGGSGSNRLPTPFWIGAAALIFGFLMLHFGGPLKGHAGVIGATATIACLGAAGLEWLLHTDRIRAAIGTIAR